MRVNYKVYCTVATILSAHSGFAHAAPAESDTAASSVNLEEITVTAQRRSENAQDVPIQIQALTAETLTQLNVATFDDFVKYLPNVTQASWGPGQGIIYMRGLSAGALGLQGQGSTGSFPNVAVYLDEQSSQLPSRNLDIYAADLERIEVLEGPQGTLFGAGAQAGLVRYITNKPKLDVTGGSVTAGYGYTSHGDPNSNVEAVLNVPLIAGTLAVRAVIYDDNRGGYINNVAGTFTRRNTDLGIHYAGGSVPPNSEVLSNNNLVANGINPVTYQGLRVSALWKINEDWDALVTQSYQDMNAQGVFFQEPNGPDGEALPDLSVVQFNPSFDKDKFENTALTINGRIGELKALYAAGYLVRDVEQVQDYTAYSRGVYTDYYQCVQGTGTAPAKCYSPSTTWNDTQRNTHLSQELRLSTPDDWRLRALGGVYWEKFTVRDQTNWLYKTLPACTVTVTTGCLSDVAPPPGATANNPNVRNDNTAFFDDIRRGYRQYAFYASADYDLIPKTLTISGGTRYYNFNDTEVGSKVSSFTCFDAGPGPCTTGATNINAEDLNTTYSGFTSRGNISWKITRDTLLYYTWSQGYRPGGFNRSAGGPYIPDQNGVKQFFTPAGYAPDKLINNEIGFKTEWFDHRLLLNGTLYREDWNNVQVAFIDPGVLGNLTFNTNSADYRVKGFETQLIAKVFQGFSVQGSASWNSSSQTNSPFLIANNPASVNFGRPITNVENPYGALGSPLALSPPFQGNIRLRYDWVVNQYEVFVQSGGQHQAHSFSQTSNVPTAGTVGNNLVAYDQPAFTTYDASLGIAKGSWTLQLVGHNITDTRGRTFISNSQGIETQTVIRPRTAGVVFGYKF